MKENNNYERVTLSLPLSLSKEINDLMRELKVSKSEVFKLAFEKFSKEHKKEKLKKIAEEMKSEYKNNKKLTEFSALDSDDFK
jgi:metal-responsive CopG/Arc/MetJ family transcriptional regulator